MSFNGYEIIVSPPFPEMRAVVLSPNGTSFFVARHFSAGSVKTMFHAQPFA